MKASKMILASVSSLSLAVVVIGCSGEEATTTPVVPSTTASPNMTSPAGAGSISPDGKAGMGAGGIGSAPATDPKVDPAPTAPADAPKVDAPKVEEPKADAPKVDAPKA